MKPLSRPRTTASSQPRERAAAIAVLDRGTTPPPDIVTLGDITRAHDPVSACVRSSARAGEKARLRRLAIELGRAVDA